ncbi:MAG: outer membrane beta-barrel protein [Xanthomonadales bacterium]|nr:outer membrane beta-barrel protein [Xanthomonadales bacterium]
MLRIVVVSAGIALAGVSGSVLAQSYDNPGLGEKPVAAHPQDFKPLGVRAGSFMLHPGVELAAQYLDNILYTNTDTISDLIWHVRPYITAQSTWSKHSFTARVAADIARYSDYGFRDYEDYFLQLGGHIDVMSRSSFSYGFDYMKLHEERNIRSAEQGITPTTYDLVGGNLGYDHLFNRFSIGVLYDLRSLNYDNSVNLEGEVIDNKDRDRTQQNFSARFGYQFKTDKQAFLMLGYQETDFDLDVDRNGYSRDSSGFFATAGVDFAITGVLSGDLSVNYHDRDFDDPSLVGISGWGLGAGLSWAPTMLTTVRGNITTGIEDTTQASSSGYFRTMYAVRVDHELLRDLQIMGQLSYYMNDYQLLPTAPVGSRKEDTMLTVDLGATYFINRSVWLSASYKYGNFDTNVPNDDFRANTAWLVLGLER